MGWVKAKIVRGVGGGGEEDLEKVTTPASSQKILILHLPLRTFLQLEIVKY